MLPSGSVEVSVKSTARPDAEKVKEHLQRSASALKEFFKIVADRKVAEAVLEDIVSVVKDGELPKLEPLVEKLFPNEDKK